MVARYGDRTRVSQQVSSWGKDGVAAGGGAKEPYQEIFTAPGTWTWPSNVTEVDVTLVGGGGGGGGDSAPRASSPLPATMKYGGGGGGGVRVERIPVAGPQPVVVGAGGVGGRAGNIPTRQLGTNGGSSSFGPVTVGGGGAGGPQSPINFNGFAAPPDGGGGGGTGGQLPAGPTTLNGAAGGTYGAPGTPSAIGDRTGGAGGAGGAAGMRRVGTSSESYGGAARDGFGGGAAAAINTGWNTNISGVGAGSSAFRFMPPVGGLGGPHAGATSGRANMGGGGGGALEGPNPAGNAGPGISGDGGSGVVIVRWWE